MNIRTELSQSSAQGGRACAGAAFDTFALQNS
jgi:hypothetical protein